MKCMKKNLLIILILFTSLCFCTARDFYWEMPSSVTSIDTRFPSAVSAPAGTPVEKASAVFWEEIDSARNRLYLSARVTTDGLNWREVRQFAGPINYSGEVPDVYSSAINSAGVIAVAAVTDAREITVFVSTDNGTTFKKSIVPGQGNPLIAPRIYASSDGGFVLFASLGQNESFKLLYASSSNGSSWSPFVSFGPAQSATNPFVPFLVPINGGDMVVYQAQYASASRLSYQLYATVSMNDLRTWSDPVLVTDQSSLPASSTAAFYNYNNQRPYLLNNGGTICIAWERTWYSSENATIWYSQISTDGRISSTPEQITSSGNANRPILFMFDGLVNMIWFDTRSGVEKVYLSKKTGALWDEKVLSRSSEASSFAYPVVSAKGSELSFVWQQTSSRGAGTSRIYFLVRDHTANPPIITPRSFREGRRYTSTKATATVSVTSDSSGIAGYSWIWTRNKEDEPPEELMNMPAEQTISGDATEDGLWYFKVRQQDFAGNWSAAATVSYFRDTTPPQVPTIFDIEKDENGLAKSNTLSLNWQKQRIQTPYSVSSSLTSATR